MAFLWPRMFLKVTASAFKPPFRDSWKLSPAVFASPWGPCGKEGWKKQPTRGNRKKTQLYRRIPRGEAEKVRFPYHEKVNGQKEPSTQITHGISPGTHRVPPFRGVAWTRSEL